MWKYERSVGVQASRQIVWQWWTNIEKWPQWDTDLSEAAVLGELAVGAQGRMKVADDALVSFIVSELIPEEKLAIQIALFGATITYTYTMSEDESGLKIIHGATISGIFGILWRMMLKNKIIKVLDAAQDSFALQVAEEAARQAAEAERVAQEAAAAENPLVQPVQVAEAPVAAEKLVLDKNSHEMVGDPVENELRTKDIHTQIEVAAQAVIPEKPVAEETEQGSEQDAAAHVALLELPKPAADEVEKK